MKWTVFDFEFTELMPKFGDPLGIDLHIACASVLSSGDAWPQVWYENGADGVPGNHLSEATLESFVAALEGKVAEGHRIATWGGASSDWRVLLRECPSKADIIRVLALESVDVPMCACMSIGMMMGLNAACMALGFSLKDSAASASMPALWATKSRRNDVLQHVSNDSYATMMVLKHAETTKTLPWITSRGQLRVWNDVVFFSVRQCLAKELPNVGFEIAPHFNAKLMARWLLLT